MKLARQQYGKALVRVMKVTRKQEWHEVKEITVAVMLEGDFADSYTSGDNSKVVPTDTMKNTVHALSRECLGQEIEEFAVALAQHFLKKYSQVSQASIQVSEKLWRRLAVDGREHPHTFLGGAQESPFTEVTATRAQATVESGIDDFLVLKSTGSGFEGYPKDEFTTLPETKDRILATSIRGIWRYHKPPKNYGEANRRIVEAMLKVFATDYSPSVQTTLYDMAGAALKAVPEISGITLKLPNKHYLPINLTPFGVKNENEIFLPTSEPHGQIEATVTRD